MKRPASPKPLEPQRNRKPSTVTKRTRHTTVSPHELPSGRKTPRPPQRRVPRPIVPRLATSPPPKRQVARVLDGAESTLLDVIDNLLAKGVMINADVILALANVDLVYLRLSALLCAADRVIPAFFKAPAARPRARD